MAVAAAAAAKAAAAAIAAGIALPDEPFRDTPDWTNGTIRRTYQNNAKGPWQLADRIVVPGFGNRFGNRPSDTVAANRRPDLLKAEADWPALPNQAQNTTFHLRRTKYIDNPVASNAIVIESDQTAPLPLTVNHANHFPNEWLAKADGIVPACSAYIAVLAGNAVMQGGAAVPRILDFEAVAIPAFANTAISMHILVDGSSLGALGGAGGQAGRPMAYDPPNFTVAQLEDFHLMQCYYAALAQGETPSQPPGQVAVMIGAWGINIPTARSITFPLMGLRAFSAERAAIAACTAISTWFNPQLGGESHNINANQGALDTLRDTRRAAYDDVYLTVPNEAAGAIGIFNPVLPAPVANIANPKDIFAREMGEQDLAWHKAFFQNFRCPTCGLGDF